MITASVYVGNLSWQTTEEDLTGVFRQVTDVIDVRIVTDRATGRSRGFAFVEIPGDDMELVIRELNGYVLDGKDLIIS